MEERRRSLRFPIHQNALISLSEGGQTLTGISQNVSSVGLFVHLDGIVALGSKVDVIIVLPPEITHAGSVRVLCASEVVRIERRRQGGKVGLALKFLTLHALPEA